MVKYSWLTDEEIEREVNPLCASRGWMELNINPATPTCRVLGAFSGGTLVGWFVLQLVPILGPLWVDSENRDGTISRELAGKMHSYLDESKARGYLVVCESPVSERLATRHGMQKVEAPVYVAVGER